MVMNIILMIASSSRKMIKDNLQYEVTKHQAEKFKKAIAEFSVHRRRKLKIAEELIIAEKSGLESMYQELLDQMQEYETRSRIK